MLLRHACGHVDVGTCPHQVLAAILTQSQTGGQIMHTKYWCPHQVLKFTGASAPTMSFESSYVGYFYAKNLRQWISHQDYDKGLNQGTGRQFTCFSMSP